MMRGFLILLCTLAICFHSRAEELNQDSTYQEDSIYTFDEELTQEQIEELEERLKTLEVITEIAPQDSFSYSIYEYYEVDEKPQPFSIPPPILHGCPPEDGVVIIKALVDFDGNIAKVEILESSGNKMLDNAALAAVKRAKFIPAKHHGFPVRVWVSIPIRFKLQK